MVEDSLLERDDVQELDTWFTASVVESCRNDRDLYVAGNGEDAADIESAESYGRVVADHFDDIEYAYNVWTGGHAFNVVDDTNEWRETFERVFSHNDDIIHETAGKPTVTTEYGRFSSFEMDNIYNEGYIAWRIYENDDGNIVVVFKEEDE